MSDQWERRALSGPPSKGLQSLALSSPGYANDGAPDPAFGGTGQMWIDVTTSSVDAGQEMIGLPNGNLFMGGGLHARDGCGKHVCSSVAGHTQVQSGEVRFTAAKELIDLLFGDGFE